jgi:hypothetical protein
MPIAELFPDGKNSVDVMAQAFATKHLWDHRYFRLKLYMYTTVTFLVTLLATSAIEFLFGFSLWGLLFTP